MEFTKEDLFQIKNHGLDIRTIEDQIENFKKGFPAVHLCRAAKLKDGIRDFNEQQTQEFIDYYDINKDKFDIVKFVPASGAATRMMKDLYAFIKEYKDEELTPIKNFSVAYPTIRSLHQFAFFDLFNQCLKKDDLSIEKLLIKKDYKTIIEYILMDKGLNYGKYPKAWILFHKFNNSSITSFEQHLQEAGDYANSGGKARLHFTITEEHKDGFSKLKDSLQQVYQDKYNLKYDISFSYQAHSTDTVAVDKNNNIIKDKECNIVFRPSGHGALIDNLNNINADIIFIKNIDNISSIYKDETTIYKKMLGGVIINLKQKINTLTEQLYNQRTVIGIEKLEEYYKNIHDDLGFNEVKPFDEFKDKDKYYKYLFDFLNRPLRVCGMVKNTGEPGGGPFYIYNNNNDEQKDISLQIVEKAQINLKDDNQKQIFLSSSHFNPVDLVVCIKDFKGNKFDLHKFIDHKTGFISEKSFEGKTIKAMERPGLWNGSMSNWLTVFVQVPIETFNPVKVITDLLKPSHQ